MCVRMYVCVRDIDFKELAHCGGGAGASQMHGAGWRPREELVPQVTTKGGRGQSFLFWGDLCLFV